MHLKQICFGFKKRLVSGSVAKAGVFVDSTSATIAEQFVAASPVRLRILVCGASGALGSEMARQLARSGTRLSLWGRNQARLDAVAQACHAAGANVATRSIDVTDVVAAVAALCVEDDEYPFDVALFIAGQGDTLAKGDIVESPEQVARLGIANFVAPAALAAEIAGRMASRGCGRICLVGTAAASHSLPFAAAYSGSKAGLARFTDALRLAVKGHGVTVTLISPGFFAPADKDARRRPAEISARIVAARAIAAVNRGKSELVTPWPFAVLRVIGALLPRPIRDRLLLSLPPP